MTIPVEITTHNMDPSPAMDDAIRARAEKLERLGGDIIGCQVRVDAPHKHHGKGKLYHVSVEIQVPGGHIVAYLSVADAPFNDLQNNVAVFFYP